MEEAKYRLFVVVFFQPLIYNNLLLLFAAPDKG